MNSRRARFVAVQALLTVVLTGVIVVTLLDPKNEVSLFAVNVPGGSGQTAEGPPRSEPQDGDRGEGGREGGSGRGGRDASGRGEGGSAAADAGAGAFAPPPGATAGADGSSPLTRPPGPGDEPPPALGQKPPTAPGDEPPSAPDDEQYDDTLARLSDAVD